MVILCKAAFLLPFFEFVRVGELISVINHSFNHTIETDNVTLDEVGRVMTYNLFHVSKTDQVLSHKVVIKSVSWYFGQKAIFTYIIAFTILSIPKSCLNC